MTEQAKTIKRILQNAFPTEEFQIRMRRAGDYARSSDRLIVSTRLTVDKVIAILRQNTKGIVIGRYGLVLVKTSDEPPVARDPLTNTDVDFDLCEFIEVEPIYLKTKG